MLLHRLALSVLVVLIAGGCAGRTAASAPVPTGSWTQFRLNPEHNAVLPGSLRVSWRLETHGAFSSSPAIVGSTLYVGNNAGTLYAIDVRNGRSLWEFHVDGPLMSNPLIYHRLVIVGEGNSKMVFGRYPFKIGVGENALLGVDAVSGVQRWRLPLSGSGMPTPAIVAGVLVHHDGWGNIITANPDSGRIFSSVEAHAVAAMSAILPLGNDHFVTSGGVQNIVQMRSLPKSGIVWSTTLPSYDWAVSDCPAASDGKSIFCVYNVPPGGHGAYYNPPQPAQLHAYAIDAQTGMLAWDTALEHGTLPGDNSAAVPLVHDGRVYFGSAISRYLHCLSAPHGRPQWLLRVHGAVKGGIVEKDGVLYFGDLGGYLWAIDAKNGAPLGSKNMHTPFNVGSPVIDGQTLIIGSKTGAIIAIPLNVVRGSHDR